MCLNLTCTVKDITVGPTSLPLLVYIHIQFPIGQWHLQEATSDWWPMLIISGATRIRYNFLCNFQRPISLTEMCWAHNQMMSCINNATSISPWDMFTHLWPHRSGYGPLSRYVISRIAHAPGMPGTFSPPPWVSDPDMHHGTYVTHVRDACRDR